MSGPNPSTIAGLLRSQIFFKPTLPTSSFKNQTVIVTGANAGLGREAAKHLVRLGAEKVILAVRTPAKGDDARKYIEAATGRAGITEVWQLDMSSFASVEAFAKKARTISRIDAVVANAGTWPSRFELAEGFEATITVNVLSAFLLIHLLLPLLRQTASQYSTTTRATVVTSTLHAFSTFPARKQPNKTLLSALSDPASLAKPADMGARYNDSKLLVQLYGARLAAEMTRQQKGNDKPGSDVCLDFVSPGWCASNLHPASGAMEKVAQRGLARTVDEGARCLVDAVALDKAQGRHGAYVDDMRIKKPAPWIATQEGQQTAERVWTEFNEILMPIVRRNQQV